MKILLTTFCFLFTFSSFIANAQDEASQADDFFMLSGFVFDSDTKKPLKAILSYEKIPARSDVGLIESDSAIGKYEIKLFQKSTYKIAVHAPKYVTAYFLLSELEEGLETKYKEFYLIPNEVGQIIRFSKISFGQGNYKLLSESYTELDNIYQMLLDNPTMEIELGGHTDNSGNAKANIELSEKRVNEVKKYLIGKGINKSRITLKAFGGSKPLVNNATPENREKNRRVEVKIVKK